MGFSKILDLLNHSLKIPVLLFNFSFLSSASSPPLCRQLSYCWHLSTSVSGCEALNKLQTRALIATASMILHWKSWTRMFSGNVGK